MKDVYLHVQLTGKGEQTRYAGKWVEVPIVPRIGDVIHYGDNYPADCATVESVEIFTKDSGSTAGAIVVYALDDGLEFLADADAQGTAHKLGLMVDCGFREMQDMHEWV